MKVKDKISDIMYRVSFWILLISWMAESICSWWVDKDSHFSTKAMVACISISAISLGFGLFCILSEVKAKEKMKNFLNRLAGAFTVVAIFAFLISIPCALFTFTKITDCTNVMDIVTAICVMVMLVGFILLIIFTPSEQKKEDVELAQPSALETAELPRKQECEEDTYNSATE